MTTYQSLSINEKINYKNSFGQTLTNKSDCCNSIVNRRKIADEISTPFFLRNRLKWFRGVSCKGSKY